ncbi:MAG: hypothetical protein QOF70_6695 [Acetobacteraceae bacterium]|nr:hypothetical protein [Acetobacteraceae bacterium]
MGSRCEGFLVRRTLRKRLSELSDVAMALERGGWRGVLIKFSPGGPMDGSLLWNKEFFATKAQKRGEPPLWRALALWAGRSVNNARA